MISSMHHKNMTIAPILMESFQDKLKQSVTENKNYPKVLILGLVFGEDTGSGITMTNLFRDWPKENIRIATSNLGYAKKETGYRCYFIGDDERISLFKFRGFFKKQGSKEFIKDMGNQSVDLNKAPSDDKRQNRFIKKSIFQLIDFLGLRPIYYRTHVSSKFLSWVKSFEPDIIYTHAGSLELIRLALEIRTKSNAKIAVHVNDDYLSTIGRNSLLAFYWKNVVNKEFRKLISHKDTICLSICQKMSEEYYKRFGKSFIPFHNPVDVKTWIEKSKTDWEIRNNVFVVLYAGRIGTGTSNSILDIAQSIDRLNNKGYPIIFEVQTQFLNHPVAKMLKRFKFVKFNEYIQYEKLPEKLSRADLLVLPMDFDSKNFRYIKYSMPTKTSEYMASGTPVIVYAPAGAALGFYARKEKWASVVDKRNLKMLEEEIISLYNNENQRRELGMKAKRLAEKFHDSSAIREQFRSVMAEEI
jgi:glycosyltransferase involved in cell wall biosynthesis